MSYSHTIVFYQIIFLILSLGCKSDNPKSGAISDIQTGDLLFQQWDNSEFAQAINAVTEGADGEDFAHIGLVLSLDDSLQVLEAVTNDGVILRPLVDFLNASVTNDGKPRVAIGRLKQDFSAAIPSINEWALSTIGMAYDSLFVYGNDNYYCSELVYDAFNVNVEGNDVFDLAPMTFKDPATKQFFPIWVSYFDEYHKEIPEGEIGVNPGLLSRSEKIDIIAKLWE